MKTLRDYLVDPYSDGRKEKIEKKGMHFTDAHPALRREYIRQLPFLPFRGYVAYSVLGTGTDYGELYCILLRKIVEHRLMACDRAKVRIVVEQNSKVKAGEISKVVLETYSGLEATNNRRPLQPPELEIGSKTKELCLSVPDFLLGVFARYANDAKSTEESERLAFERLRDKYRIIIDVDSGRKYTQYSPFRPWPDAV